MSQGCTRAHSAHSVFKKEEKFTVHEGASLFNSDGNSLLNDLRPLSQKNEPHSMESMGLAWPTHLFFTRLDSGIIRMCFRAQPFHTFADLLKHNICENIWKCLGLIKNVSNIKLTPKPLSDSRNWSCCVCLITSMPEWKTNISANPFSH